MNKVNNYWVDANNNKWDADTYTKKLAYVIYYDQKNVLRKEKSWQGWRDNKIEPQEFTNEPTSGFVLNKKVGDYSNGWDHRKSYCRVFDPRNFEFEITIENLRKAKISRCYQLALK